MDRITTTFGKVTVYDEFYKVKNNTDTKVSSTVMSNDSQLFINNIPPGTYEIWMNILNLSPAAADIQWQLTFSGAGTARIINSTTNQFAKPFSSAFLENSSGGGNVDIGFIFGTLIITATGNLQFQFAQRVSDPGNTQILPNSFIKLKKIA